MHSELRLEKPKLVLALGRETPNSFYFIIHVFILLLVISLSFLVYQIIIGMPLQEKLHIEDLVSSMV